MPRRRGSGKGDPWWAAPSGKTGDGRSASVERILNGPRAPAAARHWVRERLAEHVSRTVLDDALLLISELVTNSVLHGGPANGAPITLRLVLEAGAVRLEVTDPGEHGAVLPRPPDHAHGGGFGLDLVARLAASWGVDDRGGTRVWFLLSHGPGGAPVASGVHQSPAGPHSPPLARGPHRRETRNGGPVMTGPTNVDQRPGGALAAISSTLVALHKEQFGRGPTRARSDFAGDDTLVCVLEDALLPAERVMVQMGDQQRVRESRAALQAAHQFSSSSPRSRRS